MLRERLTSAAFGVGWVLVCRVPGSWARAGFMVGADIAWRRQGHGVQVLEGNLRRVIGADAGSGELRTLSRKVMRSYARYYLEVFRLHVIPRERLLGSGLHLEGAENLQRSLEYLKNGRGVIYALPHMGNVEQAGAWVIANGAGSLTTVAERLALEPVYERWLKFRQGLGFEVVPTTGGPRPFGVLAQRLRAGNLVCMLADRDLSDTGVEVDFFGEKALMAAGSAALAARTGAALIPASCWFVGDTGWVGYRRARRDTRAGTRQPPGEGRRHDAAACRCLRAGDQRASGRLAYAAAGLCGRPRRGAAQVNQERHRGRQPRFVRIDVSCPAPGMSGSVCGSVCDGLSGPGKPGLIKGDVHPAGPGARRRLLPGPGPPPSLSPEPD